MSKKTRFRPTVESLENRRCMAAAIGVDAVAATPEEPARGFFAYSPAFTGGVYVAGVVNNDATSDDVITGPGNGGGLHAKVVVDSATTAGYSADQGGGGIFNNSGTVSVRAGGGIENNGGVNGDADNGRRLKDDVIDAYPGFTGGVRVATGDVTGDEIPDIITTPGPGGGPHVRVFDATPAEPAQTGVADGTSNTMMVAETYRGTGTSSTDEVFTVVGRNGGSFLGPSDPSAVVTIEYLILG